jgi:uncharacterized protein (TIGR00730 family)
MLFFKKKGAANETPQRPEKEMCPQPLTLPELDAQIKTRVGAITKEFTDGFNFIKASEKTVSFFGSARTLPDEDDYKNAHMLAAEISKLGYAVVTGGGPGIMEAANRGAFENKGESLGLTIKLPMEQITNKFMNRNLPFKYFFARKVTLTYAAEAYVYFPGGFGTLDELFEILTLVQTNKIERVPVILFGSYFWNPLKQLLIDQLAVHGKIDQTDLDLFVITDSIETAVDIIKAAPIRKAH